MTKRKPKIKEVRIHTPWSPPAGVLAGDLVGIIKTGLAQLQSYLNDGRPVTPELLADIAAYKTILATKDVKKTAEIYFKVKGEMMKESGGMITQPRKVALRMML